VDSRDYPPWDLPASGVTEERPPSVASEPLPASTAPASRECVAWAGTALGCKASAACTEVASDRALDPSFMGPRVASDPSALAVSALELVLDLALPRASDHRPLVFTETHPSEFPPAGHSFSRWLAG